jgi:hypothetical protein
MNLLAQADSSPVSGYPIGWIMMFIFAGIAALAIVATTAVVIALIMRRRTTTCPHCGKPI